MIQSQEKPGQLKNKKVFAREGVGKKKIRSYLPNIFSTSLRNHLPNFFIQISLAFSPFIGIHLALWDTCTGVPCAVLVSSAGKALTLWSQSSGELHGAQGTGEQHLRELGLFLEERKLWDDLCSLNLLNGRVLGRKIRPGFEGVWLLDWRSWTRVRTGN